MRILIAGDDLVSRRLLETTLRRWRREVIATSDGLDAGCRIVELQQSSAHRI